MRVCLCCGVEKEEGDWDARGHTVIITHSYQRPSQWPLFDEVELLFLWGKIFFPISTKMYETRRRKKELHFIITFVGIPVQKIQCVFVIHFNTLFRSKKRHFAKRKRTSMTGHLSAIINSLWRPTHALNRTQFHRSNRTICRHFSILSFSQLSKIYRLIEVAVLSSFCLLTIK